MCRNQIRKERGELKISFSQTARYLEILDAPGNDRLMQGNRDAYLVVCFDPPCPEIILQFHIVESQRTYRVVVDCCFPGIASHENQKKQHAVHAIDVSRFHVFIIYF